VFVEKNSPSSINAVSVSVIETKWSQWGLFALAQ
jgi:hypothetical protein